MGSRGPAPRLGENGARTHAAKPGEPKAPIAPPKRENRKKAKGGNPMPSGPGNSPRQRRTRSVGQALAAEREQVAFALRTAGATWPQIAQQMGCAISTAYEAFQRAIKRTQDMTREQAEVWRQVALARYESVVRAHYETRGDPRSAEVILKATKQEMDLIPGAKAPERAELSGPEGTPIRYAEYEAWEAERAEMDAMTPAERAKLLEQVEAEILEDIRTRKESKHRQRLAKAREREAKKTLTAAPVVEVAPAPEPEPEPPKRKPKLPVTHPAGWRPKAP